MREQNSLLEQYLTPQTVRAKVKVRDWKEAIRVAGKLLLDIGAIEPRYIDAMIELCKKYSAYIVVAPGIALAHARPEDGAKKIAFSLITLEEPICFGHPENDPVDIVIAFSAVDGSSHIRILSHLAKFLSESINIKKIRMAATDEDLLHAISSGKI